MTFSSLIAASEHFGGAGALDQPVARRTPAATRGKPVNRRIWRLCARLMRWAIAAAALAVLVSGCGADRPDSSSASVQRFAQRLAAGGAESVIVLVSADGHEYPAVAGRSRPDARQRFRIGSVTKTFTAAIVLQLVAEGRLRLSDTVDRYLTDMPPHLRRITIRQLLNHRSGLADYTDDTYWIKRASKSPATRPIDVLHHAASQALPGTRWSYSNTNYIALGLIIEKVTGDSFARQLKQRLLDPLQLESTELPTTRRLPDLDDPGENPNVAWADGALVSNTHDLASFFAALLSGQILSAESLALMKQTTPTDRYGVADGLGLFTDDLVNCGRFWGHNGGILDYSTLVRASEDGQRVAVLSVRGPWPRRPPDYQPLLCPGRPPRFG
jgi:D-alanyl-D-alanine carboxypeptidase